MEAENFQVFRGEWWCYLSDCVSIICWPSTVMNQTQIFRSCFYWVIPFETNWCHRRRYFFNSLYIFKHSNSQWSITIFTQSHHLTHYEPLQSSIFFQPISASSLNCASTYALVLLSGLVPECHGIVCALLISPCEDCICVSDPLQHFVTNHCSSNKWRLHFMMLTVVMQSKAHTVLPWV